MKVVRILVVVLHGMGGFVWVVGVDWPSVGEAYGAGRESPVTCARRLRASSRAIV